MSLIIRKIQKDDKPQILFLMREFYSSEAVFTNGSEEIFETDIAACINDNPFLEGFILLEENNIAGYAMIAKSFSTEFARPCIWFEDLYLKKEYRGKGFIPEFVNYIKAKNPNAIFRLEAEKENAHACHVYKKLGFSEFPYNQFICID